MTSINDLLREWLPAQRWFAGKGRLFDVTDVQALPWLNEQWPRVRVELATVAYDDGAHETYQVPLEYRQYPADHLGHALVGQTLQDRSPLWVYDALQDKEVTGVWPVSIQEERALPGLRFRREPAAEPFPVDQPSIVVSAEQSNTSLIFGQALILKLFRRVVPGLSLDVEAHHALAQAGNADVAPLLGWVEGEWTDPASGDGVTGTLAMAQGFLKAATEGWDMALTSVRDLYAEADLHPHEVGGDLADEAMRMGEVIARVHTDLARALPTVSYGRDELAVLAGQMHDRLTAATSAVPDLRPYAPAIGAVYDQLARYDRPVPMQRIHGDLHLGQLLRTPEGWKVIDFEGEPARPVESRRAPDSPLRDVAGMLRSFDYAARHLLADRIADAQLEYRAREWVARNEAAFCEGYGKVSGRDPRDAPVLLRAYEADKAVYEVMYETRNRPAWVHVPLAAIERLAG